LGGDGRGIGIALLVDVSVNVLVRGGIIDDFHQSREGTDLIGG
jgi:hypothetical protein